jgi:L-aminopeptidase/D-esterase-like protein
MKPFPLSTLVLALAGTVTSAMTQQSSPAHHPAGLTAVPGIKVGHFTLPERPTGCTVVLTEAGVVAGVDVRGAAPGTRETDLLAPVNTVDKVHAIVLAGGSAFGLDAASGVVRFLDERRIGFETGVARVPIVPAAILFDLGIGDARIRPTADCGYRAASAAGSGPVAEGSVGAGAGATLGKLAGAERAMKGGVGTAAIALPDGLVVAALAAVNAVGDVIDPATGRVVAGVRTADGKGLADVRTMLRGGTLKSISRPGQNTTLVVVATNARLSKTEATKVAQMAHDGLARTISPAHTPFDGDTVFALATAAHPGPSDLVTLGSLAAEVVADAVLRAVRTARGLPGYPSASELGVR